MKPCTAPLGHHVDLNAPCEDCGHPNLVHRGDHNRGVDACLFCNIELHHLPARQGPEPGDQANGAAPVLVHLVIDGGGRGLFGITTDTVRAHSKARDIGGLVVDAVAAADYRPHQKG